MGTNDCNDNSFVCTHCGAPLSRILRLVAGHPTLDSCRACGNVADPYVEVDTTLVALDLALLRPSAFRHVLVNNDRLKDDAARRLLLLPRLAAVALLLDCYCALYRRTWLHTLPAPNDGGGAPESIAPSPECELPQQEWSTLDLLHQHASVQAFLGRSADGRTLLRQWDAGFRGSVPWWGRRHNASDAAMYDGDDAVDLSTPIRFQCSGSRCRQPSSVSAAQPVQPILPADDDLVPSLLGLSPASQRIYASHDLSDCRSDDYQTAARGRGGGGGGNTGGSVGAFLRQYSPAAAAGQEYLSDRIWSVPGVGAAAAAAAARSLLSWTAYIAASFVALSALRRWGSPAIRPAASVSFRRLAHALLFASLYKLAAAFTMVWTFPPLLLDALDAMCLAGHAVAVSVVARVPPTVACAVVTAAAVAVAGLCALVSSTSP